MRALHVCPVSRDIIVLCALVLLCTSLYSPSHLPTLQPKFPALPAGACGGELACSTCHVILAQADFDRLEEPEEEEEDMLDLAWGLTDTSRLCCQIEVEEWMEGMVITLPDESNNMMD